MPAVVGIGPGLGAHGLLDRHAFIDRDVAHARVGIVDVNALARRGRGAG